jgi:hypothetical protein
MDQKYSNAVAYFHWPPVWFVNQPSQSNGSGDLSCIVYRKKLQHVIEIKVQRQGIVVFEFLNPSEGYVDPSTRMSPSDQELESIENAIFWRTKLMNVHLICLYSAIDKKQGHHLKKMMVSPSSLLHYTAEDNAVSASHDNAACAKIHFMKCPDAIPSNFSWWREKRELTIEKSTIDLSFQILSNVLQHKAEDALQLVQLYARSCFSYENHDFNLSLITAWAVIERLIQVLWDGYIEANRERPSGQKFINAKRKKALKKHQSAASIVEILSLTHTIPLSLYDEINAIRVARNNWIHGLKSISQDQATDAIRLAREMLHLIYGIELRVPLGLNLML